MVVCGAAANQLILLRLLRLDLAYETIRTHTHVYCSRRASRRVRGEADQSSSYRRRSGRQKKSEEGEGEKEKEQIEAFCVSARLPLAFIAALLSQLLPGLHSPPLLRT